MLTIILGLVFCIALSVGLVFVFKGEHSTTIALVATMLAVFVVLSGLFDPHSGYEESKLEEQVELVSLSNSVASEGGGMLYVSVNAENVYSYRYEVESDIPEKEGKTYKTATVSEDENIEILEVETTDGSKPILAKYVAKGKKSIWTLALGAEEVTYIFYVPEGSIAKDIVLT